MIQTETVMNGFRNGNSSNSSPGFGSGNSGGGGGGSEIKYPANCASRFGSSGLDLGVRVISISNGLGFGVSADSTGGEDSDKIYEPKRNKKIVRIVTVMGYIFSVSTVAILLSLYYLFLWDPYIKGLKSSTTPKPHVQPKTTTIQQSRDLLSDQTMTTVITSMVEESVTKYDIMQDDPNSEMLTDELSTFENPFTSFNKAQKSISKNKGDTSSSTKP